MMSSSFLLTVVIAEMLIPSCSPERNQHLIGGFPAKFPFLYVTRFANDRSGCNRQSAC
jgi:hypothetical protein